MLTVRFQELNPFLDELRERPPDIEPILRATHATKGTSERPIRHHLVIASYLRSVAGHPQPQIIQLYLRCGETMPTGRHAEALDPVTAATTSRATAAMHQVESAAKDLKLQIRAGIYDGREDDQ